MGVPQKHYAKRLRAIGRVEAESIAILCARLTRRIWRIRHNEQCAVYLLADSEGYVYLVAKESYGAVWADRLPRMVVGLYSKAPEPQQLADDLTQHMLDLMAVA